jgi:hypothetical protein
MRNRRRLPEFHFRRAPADYIPDPDFVPFLWEKRNDDNDKGGAPEAEDDDAMDTTEGRADPPVSATSQVHSAGLGGTSGTHTQVNSTVLCVSTF